MSRVGIESDNVELGIDAAKTGKVLDRLYAVLQEEECTLGEAAGMVALLQEEIAGQLGMILVTPKVRRQIQDTDFGEER